MTRQYSAKLLRVLIIFTLYSLAPSGLAVAQGNSRIVTRAHGCFVTAVDGSGIDISDNNRIPLGLLQIPQLIVQIIGILNSAAIHFGVTPEFSLFDDGKEGNAVALPANPARRRPPQVRYGARLLSDDLREYIISQKHGQTLWEFGTAAIIGHEFAHIVQFQTPSAQLPSSGTRDRELHADFLSGWFIVRNAYGTPVTGQVLRDGARAFFSRGADEDAFFNEESHGTREERKAAFLAGAATFQLSIQQAVQQATSYVNTHPTRQPSEPTASNRMQSSEPRRMPARE